MVDITHSLLDDEQLRAHFVPAMSSRHKPWFITLTRDGELSNSAEPLDHRPSVLLPDAELQQLATALAAIDIDYMPGATADGADHRTLTYRVGSRVRHIMLVDGVSSDFARKSQFNTAWKLLGKLAQRVTRKQG
ncbi:hypothetical protein [Mariniblastus fucicola]|nr:hypothetical protein [Mariniblastus fucicola]QEG24807.1 hypothetical protein MFFC18_47300 [Mariniblastus fucicola]